MTSKIHITVNDYFSLISITYRCTRGQLTSNISKVTLATIGVLVEASEVVELDSGKKNGVKVRIQDE